ncbi:MAG TPA: NADPH-dependent FMN reductase [Gemmatimonadaceae bacterium]|nr:NADPH-dependent FMN reductase [Gemmatimonadaceae bacterium]
MHILAISGSLRAASSNTLLVRAAIAQAPSGVTVVPYDGLAELPHFNPDLDGALDDPALPSPVRALRAQVSVADALLISSPEYAHGVPGSLKNALDWLVGGSEMPDKPVALVTTSTRATYAQASLAETLRTMSARVVAGSPFHVPVDSGGAEETSVVNDPGVRDALCAVFRAIAADVDAHGSSSGARASN